MGCLAGCLAGWLAGRQAGKAGDLADKHLSVAMPPPPLPPALQIHFIIASQSEHGGHFTADPPPLTPLLSPLLPAVVQIHFIIASCENMVDARGLRPGDILVASNGKTVEINNTDAEGRLTLADALLYAQNQCGAGAGRRRRH